MRPAIGWIVTAGVISTAFFLVVLHKSKWPGHSDPDGRTLGHEPAGQAQPEPRRFQIRPEIYNGTDTKPGALSAVVGLTYGISRTPLCTGSLIAPSVVLTAAHCVCTRRPSNVFAGDDPTIRAGDGRGGYYQVIDIRSALKCGRQTSRTGPDLALLKLSSPVSKAAPFKFADPGLVAGARSFRIAGYGAIDAQGSVFTFRKQEAIVRPVTLSCSMDDAKTFGCQVGEEIVAGSRKSPDSCRGDSGGPLLIAGDGTAGDRSAPGLMIAGVTSRGIKGGDSACGDGGIYEAITSKQQAWISAAMQSLSEPV